MHDVTLTQRQILQFDILFEFGDRLIQPEPPTAIHFELQLDMQSNPVFQCLNRLTAKFQVQTRIEGVSYVHGSPRGPTREYVLPRDANDKKKMKDIFAHLEDYCFCGHTHTPGIFTGDGFTHPSDMFELYMLGTDEKVLINVGSVGQPRDGDPRPCYVTFDGDTVVWRRVEYDYEPTCEKIYAADGLDNFLADRLREGR